MSQNDSVRSEVPATRDEAIKRGLQKVEKPIELLRGTPGGST